MGEDVVFSESSVYQLDETEAEIEKLIVDFDAMGEKFGFRSVSMKQNVVLCDSYCFDYLLRCPRH